MLVIATSIWGQEAKEAKKTEPTKEPTVAELQKQIEDLKGQLSKADKFLQEYYRRWTTCDAQLTEIKIMTQKTEEKKGK